MAQEGRKDSTNHEERGAFLTHHHLQARTDEEANTNHRERGAFLTHHHPGHAQTRLEGGGRYEPQGEGMQAYPSH